MPDGRLTWHAGSVLPYASLWHTVLRACALNALHPRDLSRCMAHPGAAVELISDCSHNMDIRAFADALGESHDAFRWSTLGALPTGLGGALVVPRPRLCLACLTHGYHTALFSLALLDACPIHGTPLVDLCHCGAPFRATLRTVPDYGSAGSCLCGRLHFFTRETCRRPTLAPDAPHALAPVVTWLEAMSSLIRPARLEDALSQNAPGSLEWLASAARTLGIAYPSCFRPVAVPRPTATIWYSHRSPPALTRDQPPTANGLPESWQAGYWSMAAASTVYRAIARHVRRHLVPDGIRWVARFASSCDPLAISKLISCNDRARQAFIDMLWARAVEPGVERRRWPYRRPPPEASGHLATTVEQDCIVRGAGSLDVSGRHWLACHAARISVGAYWCAAQTRATAAARSGVADWTIVEWDTSWRDSAWLARATPGLIGLLAPTMAAWSMPPRASKATRQQSYADRELARRRTMWEAARGACLTWTEKAGWEVIEAIAPADADLRHRRLLGVEGGRPWCWLYRSATGSFVARWDDARLQVRADTPRAAFTALRRCAADYRRICRITLPCALPIPAVLPEPMLEQITKDYQYLVAVARCSRKGFWGEACELVEIARWYQRARVTGRWKPP